MMKKLPSLFQTIIIGGALVIGASTIMAQTFGVEYTTEWQTDFSGEYDWLNLLKTALYVPVSESFALECSTLSTAKTGGEPLISDRLTYSNIEADNIPLTLARLGVAMRAGRAEFFAGINNVNEDYFTSEQTSFFANSSCGISPTISCNYDIANYPMAAWCLHYRQNLGNYSLQTSVYPGKGYYRLLGHENLFCMNFKRDGIFSISSIDYKKDGMHCILGVALHYGLCMGDVYGEWEEASASAQKAFSAAPWLLTEFVLSGKIGLHAHASISTVKTGCKDYAGVGLIYYGRRLQPGVSINHASFTNGNESDLELSARIPIFSDAAYLQPTLHLISTDSHSPHCAGILRLNIAI